MKKSVVIESHLLPSLEYFCATWPFEEIIVERHEHYVKQSYRNRCYVMTSHGTDRFSVPVKGVHSKIPITSIEIDYSIRWQNTFWRTLNSAYAQSPYFIHYADVLHQKIFSHHRLLYDLNFELLSMCLTWLQSSKKISETLTYEKEIPDTLVDLRDVISVNSTAADRSFYSPQPYTQVFGSSFAPNLSILDLVFCEGPKAPFVLAASLAGNLNK